MKNPWETVPGVFRMVTNPVFETYIDSAVPVQSESNTAGSDGLEISHAWDWTASALLSSH